MDCRPRLTTLCCRPLLCGLVLCFACASEGETNDDQAPPTSSAADPVASGSEVPPSDDQSDEPGSTTEAEATTEAEESSTGPFDEESSESGPPTDPDAELVQFTIAAGTHGNPWNTSEDPMVVYVGQRLRIHNGDDQAHTLHCSGVPVDHGDTLAPGEDQEFFVLAPHDPRLEGVTAWDHDAGESAAFWLVALE